MAGLIYDFVEILEAESEYYEKLTEIGNLKRTHIIKGGLQELSDISKVEGHLVTKMKSVEKKRTDIMNDIATVLNLKKETITVTQIEEALVNQPEEAASLAKAKKRINDALKHFKIVNDENMLLIGQSLDYAEFSINVIKGAQTAPLTADYSKGIEKRHNSVFDAKQ